MQHIFKNKETGAEETVQPETWVWGVIYKDDTELHQFGADGTFHQIGEVDQDKIKMACLYRYDDPKMQKRIDLPWREGMRLIHKYKRYGFDHGTDEFRKVTIYVFGYKFEGKSSFIYILPDDRIIFSPYEDVSVTNFNI